MKSLKQGVALLACLGIVSAGLLVGCGEKDGEQVVKELEKKAKPGMSESEVEALYGKPTKNQSLGKDKTGEQVTFWIWEDKDKEWDLWARFGNGKLSWTQTHNRHALTKGGAAGG